MIRSERSWSVGPQTVSRPESRVRSHGGEVGGYVRDYVETAVVYPRIQPYALQV